MPEREKPLTWRQELGLEPMSDAERLEHHERQVGRLWKRIHELETEIQSLPAGSKGEDVDLSRPSRSQRIKSGFHRLGAVVAVAIILLGVGFLAIVTNGTFQESRPGELTPLYLGTGGLALAAYVTSRALGWIVSAFFGD